MIEVAFMSGTAFGSVLVLAIFAVLSRQRRKERNQDPLVAALKEQGLLRIPNAEDILRRQEIELLFKGIRKCLDGIEKEISEKSSCTDQEKD